MLHTNILAAISDRKSGGKTAALEKT